MQRTQDSFNLPFQHNKVFLFSIRDTGFDITLLTELNSYDLCKIPWYCWYSFTSSGHLSAAEKDDLYSSKQNCRIKWNISRWLITYVVNSFFYEDLWIIKMADIQRSIIIHSFFRSYIFYLVIHILSFIYLINI